MACCRRLGRKVWVVAAAHGTASEEAAALPTSLDEEREDAGAWAGPPRERVYCARMKRSYSLPARRRNSRVMTRRMTPMQDPANMPLLVMCHELDRKPRDVH